MTARQEFMLFALFSSLTLCVPPVRSSGLGRLSGTVADNGGEAVVAATVRIEGTQLGASADVDGCFMLPAVPPGIYRVLVSSVGYRGQRILGVVIESGRTTELSIRLSAATLELEPVTLEYRKPPVNLDETSERATFSQETISQLPVRRGDEMLGYQPGVIIGPDGDLNVRGGRAGDMAFYVDGICVEDPIFHKRAANIGREGMEEVQFLTGTFDAEYGSSMNGVVDIVTREGGEQVHGSAEWEAPSLDPSPYRDESRVYHPLRVLDTQDPWIPVEGRLSGTLSGPLPGLNRATFFVHGVHEAETPPTAFGNKGVRRVTGKIALPVGNGKLSAGFGFRGRDDQPYKDSWRYAAEHAARRWERNNRASLDWTQSLGRNAYCDLTLGYYGRSNDVSVFRTTGEYLGSGWQAPSSDQYFHTLADWSDQWTRSRTSTVIGLGKVVWQPGHEHQLKAGMESRFKSMSLADTEIEGIAEDVLELERGESFDEQPLVLGVWAQDTWEHRRWIFNTGLRFDYVNLRADKYISDQGLPTAVDLKLQLSPRLGVAYRLNERTSLHAGYGWFFEMPEYESLFINAAGFDGPGSPIGVVGNPNIDPERTIAYELGLKQQLGDRWGHSLTGFYKDVSNLVDQQVVVPAIGTSYLRFQNVDKSRAYGVEVSLHRNYGEYWSLDANYTLSWAEQEFEADSGGEEFFPLAWDRRHAFNTVLAWRTGQQGYPEFFGTSVLRDVSAGVLATVASGLPFTAEWSSEEVEGGGDGVGAIPDERTAAMVRLDLRLAKTFTAGSARITPFVTVDNLFDRRNPIQAAAKDEYAVPIESYPASSFDAGTGNVMLGGGTNPDYWDEPRAIHLGLLVNF